MNKINKFINYMLANNQIISLIFIRDKKIKILF